MNPHRLHAYILLSIVAVIWGIAGPVIKLTLKGLPPDIFLLYRFLISSILSIIIFIFTGFKLPQKPRLILDVCIYTFLNSTVVLGLLFWGTDKTSLLDMSLISLFGPILLILAGFIFLKDRITAKERVGILIAFIGSFLIIIEPLLRASNSSGQLWGNLLIFASLLSAAVSGIYVKKLLRQDISPAFLANLSFLVGFITFLPLVIFKYGLLRTVTIVTSASLPFHLGVLYMAIFSGTIAYTLANTAQKSIEISEAALFSYVSPIFSGILAVILLGDKLTAPAIAGSVITFIGVVIAEIKKKRYN